MKSSFLKYKLIQPKKPVSRREPHPVFQTSIIADPYTGCKYACPYCYALNGRDIPGVKTNLVGQLKKTLNEIAKGFTGSASKPSVMLGGMTDPYQEVEKEMMLTKRCIELLVENEFPLQVFTKSENVLRDVDLLSGHSAKGMAAVNITLFTLENSLWRALEGCSPSPENRLEIMSALKKKGVLCGAVLMPVFPSLNDGARGLDKIFSAAKKAGAEYLIAGGYNCVSESANKKVDVILKEHFKCAAGFWKNFNTTALEKTLNMLSKEYDLPLGIPVPGVKHSLNFNIGPLF